MDAAELDSVLIALIAAGLALIALVVTVIVVIRQSKILARYRLLLNGPQGENLEQILLSQAATIERLQAEIVQLQQRADAIVADGKLHVQKVGAVRFCAFPDTGSDLSFAIALLDAYDNGVVLSSLYGRNESRTYAKPIQGGKSTYQLSEEEKEAISRAVTQGRENGRSR